MTSGFFAPENGTAKVATSASFAVAHILRKSLPEDDFDRQPIEWGGGRYVLAGDIRLDNRSELLGGLGRAHSQPERIADSDLLAAAWEQWGEASLDRLLGDYAFALWDSVDERLTLVRAPMAMKSLYYRSVTGFVAFASNPAALFRLPLSSPVVDADFAACLGAGIHPVDGSTVYAGIQRVRHGHLIRFRGGQASEQRFWQIREERIRFKDSRDYGLGLRAELDRAVAAQLRTRGRAGAQLSAGRDSGAVAGTAARLVDPLELPAFTGAPRPGFPELDAGWRVTDESRLAAETAAMHGNIRHFVCRRSETSVFSLLGEAHLLQQEPLPNPVNLPWWWAIGVNAEAMAVRVLLGGTAGNFTISAPGQRHVVDLLRAGRLSQSWRVARGLRRQGYAGWPFLFRSSVAPWLPRSFDSLLMRATGRAYVFQKDASLLTASFRRAVESRFADQMADARPARSHYDFRRKMLYGWVFSDAFSLAKFGVELRDPTSDRGLIDYCLSLPVDALTSPDTSRPAYDIAFEDRVPAQIRTLTRRGYQGADWPNMTSRDELSKLIAHYWQSPIVAELFDRSAVQALADRWPTGPQRDENEAHLFRDQLMNAMAIANFIAVTFEGIPAHPEVPE